MTDKQREVLQRLFNQLPEGPYDMSRNNGACRLEGANHNTVRSLLSRGLIKHAGWRQAYCGYYEYAVYRLTILGKKWCQENL